MINIPTDDRVSFAIPMLPPSVNSMYRAFRGRVILSDSIRIFKFDSSRIIAPFVRCLIDSDYDFFHVEISFTSPSFHRKDGKLSMTGGDIDNMCKALIDVIFTSCNQNDSKITKITVSKENGKETTSKVSITGGFFNL